MVRVRVRFESACQHMIAIGYGMISNYARDLRSLVRDPELRFLSPDSYQLRPPIRSQSAQTSYPKPLPPPPDHEPQVSCPATPSSPQPEPHLLVGYDDHNIPRMCLSVSAPPSICDAIRFSHQPLKPPQVSTTASPQPSTLNPLLFLPNQSRFPILDPQRDDG
jgi:hypothetical protein